MSENMLSQGQKTRIVTRWVFLAFFFIVLLGGSNAVAVRFSFQELPPFRGAALRFGTAAVLFWAIVFFRRIPVPKGRALMGAILFGALTVGLSYAFLYWALVDLPASMTMVILSLGPLMTFFLAWVHRQEAFRWRGLIGSIVAFSGIVVAAGNQAGAAIPILPVLATVVAAAVTAEGSVLIKFYPKSDPIAVNAIAETVGAPMLALISLAAGETQRLPEEPSTWLALTYLVLPGTLMLFTLYLFVLQRWTASATSYAFLLFPVATVIIASWLTDEVITPRFLLGAGIVLLGVWLGGMTRGRGS